MSSASYSFPSPKKKTLINFWIKSPGRLCLVRVCPPPLNKGHQRALVKACPDRLTSKKLGGPEGFVTMEVIRVVQLALPKNSKVVKGKTWNSPGTGLWIQFRIYRWHPDDGRNPHLDTYFVEHASCGPMVLDALIKIKNEIDPTLAFRRSCREGICGSCSMNIGGTNALACQRPNSTDARPIDVYPLPHMDVIRDLVPDLSRFFDHYHRIEPWLQAQTPMPNQERLQSPNERDKLNGLYECILCACCSSACPSYWWNSETFPGPAALLQTKRWVDDSRDEATARRVERAAEPSGVFGCRQILNCAKACPKGLNPAKSIAELRLLQLGRSR